MNKIKEYRLQQGLTQPQLAVKSGVTGSFISQIEAGKKKPSIEQAQKFGKVLGVPWYSLYETDSHNNTG